MVKEWALIARLLCKHIKAGNTCPDPDCVYGHQLKNFDAHGNHKDSPKYNPTAKAKAKAEPKAGATKGKGKGKGKGKRQGAQEVGDQASSTQAKLLAWRRRREKASPPPAAQT